MGADSQWTAGRRAVEEGFPGEVAISQHLQGEGGQATTVGELQAQTQGHAVGPRIESILPGTFSQQPGWRGPTRRETEAPG